MIGNWNDNGERRVYLTPTQWDIVLDILDEALEEFGTDIELEEIIDRIERQTGATNDAKLR